MYSLSPIQSAELSCISLNNWVNWKKKTLYGAFGKFKDGAIVLMLTKKVGMRRCVREMYAYRCGVLIYVNTSMHFVCKSCFAHKMSRMWSQGCKSLFFSFLFKFNCRQFAESNPCLAGSHCCTTKFSCNLVTPIIIKYMYPRARLTFLLGVNIRLMSALPKRLSMLRNDPQF